MWMEQRPSVGKYTLIVVEMDEIEESSTGIDMKSFNSILFAIKRFYLRKMTIKSSRMNSAPFGRGWVYISSTLKRCSLNFTTRNLWQRAKARVTAF